LALNSILPPYEQTLGAVLIGAKEAVIAPLRPILREHNVTEPQWRVLRVINDHGATDATSIAQVGLLRAPSVTRILRELEDRKLVQRKPDSHDRRRVLVELEPAGRDLVAIMSTSMVSILEAYSDRFGPERIERLTADLRELSGALKGIE
jgi:homoprotocatechuate degradation regulator HpaR